MQHAWTSWRTVTGHWDTLTTGHQRTPGTTPVAAEISDLVQRTGQLAYANPRWTPACARSSQIRDPASLAYSAGDVTNALAAVHQAADAMTRIAANDHAAVIAAAFDDRLYLPTRLLPDKYDIPRPYSPAPLTYTEALLAAYESALGATSRSTLALDDLATAVNAPSGVLAGTRRASATAQHQDRRSEVQRPGPEQAQASSVPGRTELALNKLRIRDPALLLRAAVIDQTARDLVAEATTKARSRDSASARTRPARFPEGARPARTVGQDMPVTAQKVGTDHANASTRASNHARPTTWAGSNRPTGLLAHCCPGSSAFIGAGLLVTVLARRDRRSRRVFSYRRRRSPGPRGRRRRRARSQRPDRPTTSPGQRSGSGTSMTAAANVDHRAWPTVRSTRSSRARPVRALSAANANMATAVTAVQTIPGTECRG
jgi:hypothetical protein